MDHKQHGTCLSVPCPFDLSAKSAVTQHDSMTKALVVIQSERIACSSEDFYTENDGYISLRESALSVSIFIGMMIGGYAYACMGLSLGSDWAEASAAHVSHSQRSCRHCVVYLSVPTLSFLLTSSMPILFECKERGHSARQHDQACTSSLSSRKGSPAVSTIHNMEHASV